MNIEIAWETLSNIQTKKFKDETAAIEWIRKNCEKIVSINGIATYGVELTHFEIVDCLHGITPPTPASSLQIANAMGFKSRFKNSSRW